MKGLIFERSVPRFLAARVVANLAGSGRGAAVGPLRLTDLSEPDPPGPEWQHVQPLMSGICGSDLATIDGASSRYFEGLVSMPFVPGHEVVGVLSGQVTTAGRSGLSGAPTGSGPAKRVVVEPVLACAARGLDPPCAACRAGRTGRCERVAVGHLAPGLQIGYCSDTGGGWSAAGLVAHSSQIHPVPDELSDEDAVMVEPAACAIHAVLSSTARAGADILVVGAGTIGLLVVAALRHLVDPRSVTVGARYEHQRALALDLGADTAVPGEELGRAARRRSASFVTSRHLSSGADVVFDCVGSAASITQSISLVRPGGDVVLLGMPSSVRLDLAPLWHREVRMAGAYAYGTEETPDGPRRTFDIALELAGSLGLGRLVSARYPIERFEDALAHAGDAGRRGAVKIVFDLAGGGRREPARAATDLNGPAT
ncbi:MAG: zinc-dependent alcohol dehydrogenase [Acidimicrobiales bacterium]|nr:zinc-binding dehydrogenase [Actinomycetota bacterium]